MFWDSGPCIRSHESAGHLVQHFVTGLMVGDRWFPGATILRASSPTSPADHPTSVPPTDPELCDALFCGQTLRRPSGQLLKQRRSSFSRRCGVHGDCASGFVLSSQDGDTSANERTSEGTDDVLNEGSNDGQTTCTHEPNMSLTSEESSGNV